MKKSFKFLYFPRKIDNVYVREMAYMYNTLIRYDFSNFASNLRIFEFTKLRTVCCHIHMLGTATYLSKIVDYVPFTIQRNILLVNCLPVIRGHRSA
jgi:hypothetical protein